MVTLGSLWPRDTSGASNSVASPRATYQNRIWIVVHNTDHDFQGGLNSQENETYLSGIADVTEQRLVIFAYLQGKSPVRNEVNTYCLISTSTRNMGSPNL